MIFCKNIQSQFAISHGFVQIVRRVSAMLDPKADRSNCSLRSAVLSEAPEVF